MPRNYNLQEDLTGQVFGRLTAVEPVEHVIYWKCVCVCGNVTYARGRALKNGKHQSCGCLNRDRTIEVHTKHGMARTRIFKIHTGILQRCYNTTNPSFGNYGGRGITVCEGWRVFENFARDIGERPTPKHSVDRGDNDGGYWCGKCDECVQNDYPLNGKWRTVKEQQRNRRITKFLTFKDQTKAISEWADLTGISGRTIWTRVNKFNWSAEDAITIIPARGRNRREGGERIPLHSRS